MFSYLKKVGKWLSVWVKGARLRTLPAAFVPVFVGSGIASRDLIVGRFLLALGTALCLQIGVNFANDYSDGKRGTDSPANRRGPLRLTGSGLRRPESVLSAAMLFFLFAGFCGLALAALTSWWVLAFGGVALLAAWGYTGKPFSYGYRAMGEVSVLIFFGFAAVAGSAYVQIHVQIQNFDDFIKIKEIWLSGAGVGLMSTGVLIANNYRDIESDKLTGKTTLAVLLGQKNTGYLYISVLFGAIFLLISQTAVTLLILLGLIGPILSLVLLMQSSESGNSNKLISPKLGHSILGLLGYGLGLSIAFWINPVS